MFGGGDREGEMEQRRRERAVRRERGCGSVRKRRLGRERDVEWLSVCMSGEFARIVAPSSL